jgi:hypothetical protein
MLTTMVHYPVFCILTWQNHEGSPLDLPQPEDVLSSSVSWSPGNHHQYPVFAEQFIILFYLYPTNTWMLDENILIVNILMKGIPDLFI